MAIVQEVFVLAVLCCAACFGWYMMLPRALAALRTGTVETRSGTFSRVLEPGRFWLSFWYWVGLPSVVTVALVIFADGLGKRHGLW